MRKLLTSLALLLISSPAAALVPVEHSGLHLREGAARPHRNVTSVDLAQLPAGEAFIAAAGGRWKAIFDADTGAAVRVYGAGIPAPDSVASEDAARRYARALLNAHVELFAPGVSAHRFIEVSNVVHRGVRVVGFRQTLDELEVEGGQISFRFKHDRMIAVGAETFPQITLPSVRRGLSKPAATAIAESWLQEELGLRGTVREVGTPFVHAAVTSDGRVLAARVVRVVIATRDPMGVWHVDIDIDTGRPFARRQTLMFFDGNVAFNAPDRHPRNGRIVTAAPYATVTSGGANLGTNAQGQFTWTSSLSQTATISVTPIGRFVRVIYDGFPTVQTSTVISDGETFLWDGSANEFVDAQLNTYTAAHSARDYVENIAPELPYLARQLQATVNINEVCNAVSDGEGIFMFRAGQGCENTGRLPDVVRHEYAHSVHNNAVIPGVGSFDSSLSEGASDYLAATMVDDPGMGRGFFLTDEPLRHLDPEGSEARWPEDRGESHTTGLIFAGAMWDLRKVLIEMHGYAEGVRIADQLWYGVLQRAADVPSSYVEVLVGDDDDGNLENGTPHICEITAAFDAHGLADGGVAGLRLGGIVENGRTIALEAGDGAALCPGDEFQGAALTWEVRGRPEIGGTIDMSRVPGLYQAELPPLPEGEVLRYKVELTMGNGSVRAYPNNPADPMYEVFIGNVTPIYCTDFEANPMNDGWESEMLMGRGSRARDEWEWGEIVDRGVGDPGQAYSGTRVVGTDLGTESFGTYQRGKIEELRSPAIDVSGFDVVRLQYRRWLTIEDGDNDQAEIYGNGQELWQNLASGTGSVHHLDREWRFHDVDLSAVVADGRVQVAYRLTADEERTTSGGWTIDDFCVVGFAGPTAACGDGTLDFGETCDDGNQVDGDGCQADCSATPEPVCGNGIIESGEACDDGNSIPDDGCEASCVVSTEAPIDEDPIPDNPIDTVEDPGCGCSGVQDTPLGGAASWGVFGLLGMLLVLRRRRA